MLTRKEAVHFLIAAVINRSNKVLTLHRNLYYNRMTCSLASFLYPQIHVARDQLEVSGKFKNKPTNY